MKTRACLKYFAHGCSPKTKSSKTTKYNISIVQHFYYSKNESLGSQDHTSNTGQKRLGKPKHLIGGKNRILMIRLDQK